MLGTLRFLLALAVAFSHMGLTPNFHFGAAAVAVFYLIAGYVMSHSFQVNFGGALGSIWRFYADRFFRIYPLYAVSLLMLLAFVAITHYGKLYLDPLSVFVNITVLGGNTYPTLINPPTWSLGTEAQFYLLFPFIFCFPRLRYPVLITSYLVFTLASFEVINPVTWGYKALPGTLWLFVLGSVLYDMHGDSYPKARRVVIGATTTTVLHLAILSLFNAHIDRPYALESLCGMLLGCGAILTFADSRPRFRQLDNWLGRLSYPLFLSHACVLYFFDHLRIIGLFAPALRGAMPLMTMVSLLVSVPLAALDERFQRFRKRRQHRPTAAPAGSLATADLPEPALARG